MFGICSELDTIYGVYQIVDILWDDVANRKRGFIEFEEAVKEIRKQLIEKPNKPEDFVIQSEEPVVTLKPKEGKK